MACRHLKSQSLNIGYKKMADVMYASIKQTL